MSRHPGIDVRPGAGGRKVYRVRIYSHGQYVGGRTFDRLTDAREWQSDQVRRLKLGNWVAPSDSAVTVAEMLDRWKRVRRPVRPATSVREEELIRLHIVPHLGRQPLSSVSPSAVSAWANDLGVRSPATARQAVGLLRQVIGVAVGDGLLTRNPVDGVRLGRPGKNEPNPLTHEQVVRLTAVMPTCRDRLMVLTMAYGGLRWGELAGLRVSSVRPSGLRLVEAYSESSGGLGPLKDHESRTVPLPSTVRAELGKFATGLAPDAILFASSRGTPLRNRNWRRQVLSPALASLDFQITPHNLRDTAASLAVQSGASVVAVARMLGHEDPSTTLRHYAGLFPDDLDGIAERMDQGLRAVMEQDRSESTGNAVDMATDHTPTERRPSRALTTAKEWSQTGPD